MNKTKHHSIKVYACPYCWRYLYGYNESYPKCMNHNCRAWMYITKKEDLIVFDSITEHDFALKLKLEEKSGVIGDLKHHEVFDLVPAIHLFNEKMFMGMHITRIKDGAHIGTVCMDSEYIPKPQFCVYPALKYNSDFTYTKDGKKAVVEVNGPPSLAEFRTKCKLMKTIYGLDVHIWAGSKVFRFDEKWKLKEENRT